MLQTNELFAGYTFTEAATGSITLAKANLRLPQQKIILLGEEKAQAKELFHSVTKGGILL